MCFTVNCLWLEHSGEVFTAELLYDSFRIGLNLCVRHLSLLLNIQQTLSTGKMEWTWTKFRIHSWAPWKINIYDLHGQIYVWFMFSFMQLIQRINVCGHPVVCIYNYNGQTQFLGPKDSLFWECLMKENSETLIYTASSSSRGCIWMLWYINFSRSGNTENSGRHLKTQRSEYGRKE